MMTVVVMMIAIRVAMMMRANDMVFGCWRTHMSFMNYLHMM